MTRRSLAALVVFVGLAGCTKKDSLVLLDLRISGPLGAPVERVRLSAKGWPTRVVDGTIGLDGFRVGYYGPGDGSSVAVLAEALVAHPITGVDCVLGSGSATVPALKAGATSAPTTLFIRALAAKNCVVDAGTDHDAGEDAGTDAETDAPGDANEDTGMDATDAGVDAETDAPTDATDASGADSTTDETDDGSTTDAATD